MQSSSISDLLKTYNENHIVETKILDFRGVNKTIYNPSSAFEYNSKLLISARVEEQDKFAESETYFFENNNGLFVLRKDLPFFKLEDPFIIKVNNLFVFGGVEVYKSNGNLDFRTVFYKGETLETLERFAEGPLGMKDIRLVQLPDNRIGVFTRPQKGVYGLGQIGYLEINNLDELADLDFYSAKIICTFPENTWGGVNSPIFYNNQLYVFGHIANVSKDNSKNYYGTSFIFDLNKKEVKDFKIILKRDNFPKSKSKYPWLENVVFPSACKITNDYIYLYSGLSDYDCGFAKIKNYFK